MVEQNMSGFELSFADVRFTRGSFRLEAHLSFPAGRLTVILGPSGCGKSTLLDLAAGFLLPESGRILEGKWDVTSLAPEKRRVGVVFQDYALFPNLSVLDNVAFGPRVRGKTRKEAHHIAGQYLELCHMSPLSDRKPLSLSGGECQRVSLARALAINPELLLLDEPFGSLDAALRRELRAEVRRIQKETGITTILVTHDQDEALSLADHLAVMQDGRIIQSGEPIDIWKNPVDLSTALFLGRSTRLKALGVDRDAATIRTSAGIIRMESHVVFPDAPATLIVRPEDMRLADNGPLEGVVISAEFVEGLWRIWLTSGEPGDLLDCNYYGNHPPHIGDSLRLDVAKGATRILPGQIDEP